jgi:arsenate reductase
VTIKVYGIPNCNSVKKARDWLTAQGLEYTFHDFKKEAVTAGLIETWLKKTSLDTLINRKGTTWRALSDHEKSMADQKNSAIELMIQKPSLIKRPVIVKSSNLVLGFDLDTYKSLLS